MEIIINNNYIMNQRFIVQYDLHNIRTFEINSKKKMNLFYEFSDDNEITNIEFNPCIDNIILISYNNGICKIFNILNKNKVDFILFEGINNCSIICSKFNYLNPNIIASKNLNSSIIIWDVRQLSLLQIIESNNDKIINFKWSYFSNNLIEVRTYKKAQLIDIQSKKIIAEYAIKKLDHFLFLDEKSLLIFKHKSIEKIDISAKKIINEIKFNDSFIIKVDLIQYNYLIIITYENILFIYDISSFSEVKNCDFKFEDDYNYFFYPLDNKILYYSFCDTTDEMINNNIIDFNINFEKNKSISIDNINNNFYIKYEKVISKYMSLLNFKENKDRDELYFEKNYMKIKEVQTFFNDVKKINIFSRKEIVNYILNNIKNDNLKGELSIDKFKEISRFSNIIKIKDMSLRKKEILKKIGQINSPNIIKDIYIEIVKLLSIDNTNSDLLGIYLIFINSFEKNLINYFTYDNIQKYKEEIEYYQPCFSKKDYKILFGRNKEGEKELVLNFIDKAYSIKSYKYNNQDLKASVEKLKDINFPKFNQTIEFDCPNEELKWHLIKVHIFSKFKRLELIEKEQENLRRLKRGIITVKEKKLLIDENILKDKYKLATSVYLITNPCDAIDSSNKFISNLLLSKKNTKNEIENKFNIKIEKISEPLKYNDIEYKDCEYLCLDNLDESNNDFTKEEKYNFNYIIDNFEKKHNNIKVFLKNIMAKQTFIDAYNILFGDGNYKLKDPKYLEEFVENRLKFIPSRPFSTLAISDKISLNTFIFIKSRNIITPNNLNISTLNHLKDLLHTGSYVLIEEHEIFHLLDCIPYYENNCGVSRDTPRKKNYQGKKEGGEYLELLLFDKIFSEMNLNEVLFILNEANYDKPLIQFKEDFKKMEPEDIKIKGVFSYFNDCIEINESGELKNGDIIIILKERKMKMSDFKIKIYLEDDVVGRM